MKFEFLLTPIFAVSVLGGCEDKPLKADNPTEAISNIQIEGKFDNIWENKSRRMIDCLVTTGVVAESLKTQNIDDIEISDAYRHYLSAVHSKYGTSVTKEVHYKAQRAREDARSTNLYAEACAIMYQSKIDLQ